MTDRLDTTDALIAAPASVNELFQNFEVARQLPVEQQAAIKRLLLMTEVAQILLQGTRHSEIMYSACTEVVQDKIREAVDLGVPKDIVRAALVRSIAI